MTTPTIAAAALGRWEWEPGIAIPLVMIAGIYSRGLRSIAARGGGRGIRRWEIASFAAGWATLAVALLSPLHEMSEQLFSAHMIQHELLMAVAAPLLVAGQPMLVMLWAFPLRTRQAIGRATKAAPIRRVWLIASRPLDAWLIHGIVIWGWHVPALFQATLRSNLVHGLQHLSFLGSALLFWWAVIHPRRRAALGLSIVYLFTTAVHTAVLGALMTVARAPWYPLYAATGGAVRWGMTPLQDQQLAGLVMWIPAGLVYLVAALILLRRWIRDSEWTVAQGEHVPLTS
jgi:cytochrome c oxidase assembly factor CtaG